MHGRQNAGPKKSRKSRGDVDVNDDVVNEEIQAALESSSVQRGSDGEELTAEDLQDQMIENLAEKRSSTRIAALTRLVDQLQTNVDYDLVSGRLDTLEMYLLASVKKGEPSEVHLACRALSLIAVILGAEADKLVHDATPVLAELLKNSSKASVSRASVAGALGFINFIGSSNDHETQAAMQALVDQLRATTLPEPVAQAAWESFSLLASTLPTHKLAGEVLTAHLPLLVRYLDHESIDVKTAAGECIALLWEAKQTVAAEAAGEGEDEAGATAGQGGGATAGEVEDELEDLSLGAAAVPTVAPAASSPGDDDDDAPLQRAVSDPGQASPALSGDTRSPAFQPRKRPYAKQRQPSSRATTATSAATASSASSTSSSSSTSAGASSSAALEASLIEKFSALAKDSGRYQSKKDRATQKKNFREFLRTVEEGDVPDESLKIEKSRHQFEGWCHIVQLDAIRDVIGKGLNTHFVHNETLKEIFDLYIESGEGVDDPNRKAASRAQSALKARENFESRQKSRRKKQALANSFGLDD